MQILVALMYFTLAWYFGQLGGGLGASQRWWFPVSPTYWGCGTKKTREGLVEGDTLSREQIQSKEQRSVRTYKISKAFKDQSAVKEVSLQMERGECFVLLGHNVCVNIFLRLYLVFYSLTSLSYRCYHT
jgi:hypothetical protein